MKTFNTADSYKYFFEHSSQPSLLVAADYHILDANHAARTLYGFEGREQEGKDWFSLVDTSEKDFESQWKQNLKEGEAKLRMTGIRKDGRRFSGMYSWTPVETEKGRMYICTISEDGQNPVTHPTTHPATLSEINEGGMSDDLLTIGGDRDREVQDQLNILKLTRIYDNLSEVVYMYEITNKDVYKFESVNRAFLSVTGLMKEQVVGKYVEEVIPEPSLTLVRSKYALAIESGQTVRWEEVTPYPTGVKTGLVSVTPLYDEHHNCTHLLGTVMDITEIRAAERELQISNERYVYATKATREAIYDWDVITDVIYQEEGFAKLFGFDVSTITDGFSFWKSHLHPDEQEVIHQSMVEFLEDGEREQWECEYRFRRADGSYVSVADRSFALRDGAGTPLRVMGAMYDLTTRKKHEAERELLISHLTQRNTELEQFSFITSHNLRAPVSNLLGLTGLLGSEPTDWPKTQFILSKITESAQQLDSIVEDLSEVLVVKSSKQTGAERISLEKIFREVSQSAEDLLSEAGARVKTDFSGGDTVYFSREYLRNILFNLLSNAVKFRSPQRDLVIKVQTETVDGKTRLSFSDNGRGIDLGRYNGRIFHYQRFQAKEGSKGIGLFMAQEQLRAMGGSITVASEVNVGTTFTLFFAEPPL